ncbi:MAG TPA: LCP family protein [Streptosporangiaceae bacterium]
MSETPIQHELTMPDEAAASAEHSAESAPVNQSSPASPAEASGPAGPVRPAKPARRHRRARRIAVIAVASVVAVAGVVALGGFLAVRHLEGNIHRIPNVFTRLTAVTTPVMPAATRHSMTILLTGSDTVPAQRGGSGIDRSSTAPQEPSALIALVHLNANRKAGAIVSIPANTVVDVPGHGRTKISNSLRLGGPSLLIGTVQRLTGVRIDHYVVVDVAGLASALGPLGGVNVSLPAATTSNGVAFHAGVNHLTSATALDYAEQASLSEERHALRQQALLRAILDKLARENLLGDPASAFGILNAFTKALSVDSNFSNSDLQSLAMHLHLLGAGSGTFVTAPVQGTHLNGPVSHQLWNAIRHDAVASFAQQHPSTVTTAAPS